MHSCYWCGSTMEKETAKRSPLYAIALGGKVIFTELTKAEALYEYEGYLDRGISDAAISIYQIVEIVEKPSRFDIVEE